MALQIDVTPEQLHLLKLLHRDTLEWEDLHIDQKLDVYRANFDITEVVEQEKLAEFEHELALEGYFGPTKKVKAEIKDTANELL